MLLAIKWIGFISIFLLLTSGLFSKIIISEKIVGPFEIVYKEHIGDYSKVGPTMDEIYYGLKDVGIQTTKGIGVYYDDPRLTERSELRSDVGSILEPNQIYDGYDFKQMMIEKGSAVVAEFPYKSKMSIIFGVIRVYPKLNKYIEDNEIQAGPIIEVYDLAGGKIQYISGLIAPI